jgi:hypothetical protein
MSLFPEWNCLKEDKQPECDLLISHNSEESTQNPRVNLWLTSGGSIPSLRIGEMGIYDTRLCGNNHRYYINVEGTDARCKQVKSRVTCIDARKLDLISCGMAGTELGRPFHAYINVVPLFAHFQFRKVATSTWEGPLSKAHANLGYLVTQSKYGRCPTPKEEGTYTDIN